MCLTSISGNRELTPFVLALLTRQTTHGPLRSGGLRSIVFTSSFFSFDPQTHLSIHVDAQMQPTFQQRFRMTKSSMSLKPANISEFAPKSLKRNKGGADNDLLKLQQKPKDQL